MMGAKQRRTYATIMVMTLSSLIATSSAFVTPFAIRPMSGTRSSTISWGPRMHSATPAMCMPHTSNKVLGYSLYNEKEAKTDTENDCVWPRILVVSRRHLRKGKFVDFVGEYHIDLLQEFGAAPILLPRTMKTLDQLDAFTLGGIDGVLLMEGSDIGEQYQPFGEEGPDLVSPTRIYEAQRAHSRSRTQKTTRRVHMHAHTPRPDARTARHALRDARLCDDDLRKWVGIGGAG